MAITEQTYERVALEDPEGLWELVCGRLRGKQEMTTEHGYVIQELDYQLSVQLDLQHYSIRTDPLRLRAPSGSHSIPDLCVVPRASLRRVLSERRRRLEVYTDVVPFVVEVWSPSTGRRDRDTKLAEYRSRGDQEIWLIHPRRRTMTAWRRQPDGSNSEALYRGGGITLAAVPGVSIDLEALFEPV